MMMVVMPWEELPVPVSIIVLAKGEPLMGMLAAIGIAIA